MHVYNIFIDVTIKCMLVLFLCNYYYYYFFIRETIQYKPQQHRSVISSDAALTILRSIANGTKIGQNKRKRTAKTTTVNKQ